MAEVENDPNLTTLPGHAATLKSWEESDAGKEWLADADEREKAEKAAAEAQVDVDAESTKKPAKKAASAKEANK
jgi:wobble nucleotide-excising tRNase